MNDSPAPDASVRDWLSAHGYSDDRFVRTVLRARSGLRLEPDAAAEAVSTLYLSFQARAVEGKLPRFANEDAFCSYLFTVARNYLVRASRAPKGGQAYPVDVHEFSTADATARVRQYDRVTRGELVAELGEERVRAVLSRLPDRPPPPLRRLAELVFAGRSFTEIARELAVSKATVTRRVRDAEAFVHDLLRDPSSGVLGTDAPAGGGES